MKKLSYLIVLALILGLVLTGCLLSNVGQVPTTEQSGISYLTKGGVYILSEYKLYAGQNIPVGIVNVWNDFEKLYVQYVVDDPWEMTGSHLYVGKTDPVEFPSTPGQFPYSPGMEKSPSPNASYYDATTTYTIYLNEIYEYEFVRKGQGKGLNAIGVPGVVPGDEIYIAAQAEVFRPYELLVNPGTEEETAWAVDESDELPVLNFGKNWATYTIFGIDPSDILIFDYYYYDGANWVWGNMPKFSDGSGNVTGYFGDPTTGFSMSAPYDEITTFRINITNSDTYTVVITLDNLVDPCEVLALFTQDVAVFPEAVLAVGDLYGGGIVAYILQPEESNGVYNYDPNEQHGLIAATADATLIMPWSNITSIWIGTTGTALGTGQANTTAIVGQAGCTSGAAYYCDNLTIDVYGDWFLPSRYELNLMYTNLHNIADPIGGFVGYFYWSSSEGNRNHAWGQYFPNGYRHSYYKYHNFRVRAVRAF
jgi:hypothetical protein